MDLNQLGLHLELTRKTPHMFFLGAGASVSSGVLSAGLCIEDWKRRLFLSETSGNNDKAPATEIDDWCSRQLGYPPEGSEEEYSFYVEKCYPSPNDRKVYFEGLQEGKRPALGYQLLALLAQEEIVKAIWTTNFDGLAAKAVRQAGVELCEAGLDSTQNARRVIAQGRPTLSVALHGDYLHSKLKNAAAELRSQDEMLRKAMLHRLRDFPLIVIGYSGRDKSIMSALEEAYSEPWNGELFWCGYEPEPNPKVATFLEHVKSSGTGAHYIKGAEFDMVMAELTRRTVSDSLKPEALKLIKAAGPTAKIANENVVAAVEQFAREYAHTREKMKPGNERTAQMEGLIATRLRSLRLEPWSLLPDLTKPTAEPGKKLAATVLLQQKADPQYLDFLADCQSEKPFIGYHAALAVQFAASTLGNQHERELRDAIWKAKAILGPATARTDRYRVLEAAEAILLTRAKPPARFA